MATNDLYRGTVTKKGRNLIASLVAGETIEFTRVVVGKGLLAEDEDIVEREGLVEYVADAAITDPLAEEGVVSMIVQFTNAMNGGLKETFWLTEFGIYARTIQPNDDDDDTDGKNDDDDSDSQSSPPTQDDGILLYYGYLGELPQPVSAFKNDRLDIRRYPVTIELDLENDITVSCCTSVFVTWRDLRRVLAEALAKNGMIVDITAKAEDWVETDESDGNRSLGYEWMNDAEAEGVTSAMFPILALFEGSLPVAANIGLCATVETGEGFLRLYAKRAAEVDMAGTLSVHVSNETIMSLIPGPGTPGGDSTYTLPPATSMTLGGVIVRPGSGLLVDGVGNLSIDAAREADLL